MLRIDTGSVILVAMSNKTNETNEAARYTPVKNGLRQALNTGIFYLFVKVGGQLFRDCCNTQDRRQAEQFLADKRAELDRAKASGVDLKNTTTWSHFEGLYRTHLEHRVNLGEDHEEGLKESSALTYRQGLDRWHKLWPEVGDVAIRSITDAKIVERLEPIRGKISRTQFNRTYLALDEVFKIALREKAILVNPLQYVKRSSKRLEPRHIPERAEWDRFINYILNEPGYKNAWKRQVVDFLQGLCVTGLRLSEARAALKEDVKIWADKDGVKRGTFSVRDGKTKTSIRTFDLIPPAITVIEHLLATYPKGRSLFPILKCYATFVHVCGKHGLNLSVLDKKGNAKPIRYTHHTCRHVFATLCIENGVDDRTISHWLGHNDGGLLVAKTYGHLRRERAQEQAAKVTNVPLIGFEAQQQAATAPIDAAAQIAALRAQLAALEAVVTQQPQPENVIKLSRVA